MPQTEKQCMLQPGMAPSIDLAIVTLGEEGIRRVAAMVLPPCRGIRYVVSWQRHEGIAVPPPLERDDVEICRFDGVGISANRNNAIDHCKADVVLFADDDLAYIPGSFMAVAKAFADNPGMDVALFKASFPLPKQYPPSSCRIGLPFPKGYYATSFEIAFRRESVSGLRCHPRLGIGAQSMTCGEDEFFVISAIKRGLSVWFINELICSHPAMSTGLRASSPGTLRANGFIISILYPLSFPLRIILKATRLSRSGKASLPISLRYLIAGALRKGAMLRVPEKYRWPRRQDK